MAQYVVAGASTVSDLIKYMIRDSYMTNDTSLSFIDKTTDLYLTSIGEVLDKKNGFNPSNFVSKVEKLYKETYHNEWFHNTNKVVDSGGYQISIGYIKRDQIEVFIDKYIEICNNKYIGKNAKYILSLDIIADSPTVKDVNDLIQLNKLSIERTIKECDISKIFFIYHFINPKLEETWWNQIILPYFDKFNHFSIGGLVAFNRNSSFPFNVYILPLLKIINEKKRRNMNESFVFHILGVSSITDIFSFVLFEKLLTNVYGINIKINFDSTRVLRETSIGKTIPTIIENQIYKISFRSSDLHIRHKQSNLTNGQILAQQAKNFVKEFEINLDIPDEFTKENLYKDKGYGPIYRKYERIFILMSIHTLHKVTTLFDDYVSEVMHSLDNHTKLQSIINDVMLQCNYNKYSKTLLHKSRSLLNTINMIYNHIDDNKINVLLKRTLSGMQPMKIFGDISNTDSSNILDVF